MLEIRIKEHIRANGPMSLADYMAHCLYDAQHGYYRTRDPLGAGGDFTTSPEISQLFGEMVAAWLALQWLAVGRPERTLLVELGPGRGTLMADILRTLKTTLPECHATLEVLMVEINPFLKAKQQAMLEGSGAKVEWREEFTDLPALPMLLVANEFFDALPIRQFRKTGDSWEEKAIGLESDKLAWMWSPSQENHTHTAPIIETSPASASIMASIAQHIAEHTGAALIVDYGYLEGHGDTFQALKAHKYADPLVTPGEADLTAHVDFATLKTIAQNAGAKVCGGITQGDFLQQMGIQMRVGILCKNASSGQQQALLSGMERLTSPDAMGNLFKCLAIVHPDSPQPYGFPSC